MPPNYFCINKVTTQNIKLIEKSSDPKQPLD